MFLLFFFSSRRRHTRLVSDWSSDVCSSDLIELDRAFHDGLVAPAGMPYLRELIDQARRRSDAFRRAHTYVIPGLSASSNLEHAEILASVEQGDVPRSVERIHRHLRNAADHLIGYLAAWTGEREVAT